MSPLSPPVILDPWEISMQSWPAEILISFAGTMARTLRLADEIEPSRGKLDKAAELEALQGSLVDRLGSTEIDP